MGDLLQPVHIIILLVIACCFFLPMVFYALSLQKTLKKCAPESRTIEPGLVWLTLVPFANFIMNFFIVMGIAKTLRNEFDRRGIPVADLTPGQGIGIAMSVCLCCAIIPILGAFAGLANFVLWIIYWVKIVGYSRLLDVQPQMAPPINAL